MTPADLLSMVLAFAAAALATLAAAEWARQLAAASAAPAESDVATVMTAVVARGVAGLSQAERLRHNVGASLARAGRGRDNADEWIGRAVVEGLAVAAVGGAVIALVAARVLSLPLACAVSMSASLLAAGGWVAMRVSALRSDGARRVRRIVRLLPYSVELVTLIAAAGGSIEEGFESIVETMTGEPLADEIAQVLREQRLGAPFLGALRAMAARLSNNETSQLATTIEIGRQLGTPVVGSLTAFSEWIRTKRVVEGERLAREAAPKMALPNTLIMMANVVLILTPFLGSFNFGDVL